MTAPNEVSYFIDSGLRTTRATEVPNADWDGGLNYGGSNAPAVGTATGVNGINPPSFTLDSPTALTRSQVLGGNASAIFVQDPSFGDNALTGVVEATAQVAPDDVVATTEGFDMHNRTGETLEVGDRVFGVGDNSTP